MNYIRWFDEIGADDVGLVGGKGANLGEMVAAGLPVPPGFCLTATAYRDFINSTGLQETIREILAETDFDDLVDVEAKSADIRQAIREQAVPPNIAEQLREGYARLVGEIQTEQERVAVRSSATAEDLPDHAFPGLHDTYLNISGFNLLQESVRNCWASLWNYEAMTYRDRNVFDHEQVYLSVVVQAMVPSEISGIMFTANPVTGARGEAVLNASWGLGEAIVGSIVTPDTITVRKEEAEVASYEIGTKEITITHVEGKGTVEQETPGHLQGVPALKTDQVEELVALGRQVEAHYGAPQDIEWAYYQERPYLVQSRPITTALQPERVVVEDDTEYNRTMFVEILPEPLSPSFLTVFGPIFQNTLDFTFETLGFKPPKDMDGMGLFYNRVYFNRNYIEAALEPLSPAFREQLVSQFVNPFGDHESTMRSDRSIAFYRMMWALLRFMVRFPKQLPDVLESYRADIARAEALSLEQMNDTEIVKQVEKLTLESAGTLVNYDFLMIMLIGITYQVLSALLEGQFGEQVEEVRGKLVSGVTGNVTMETNKALWDLAQTAMESPSVRELLRRYDSTEVQAHLSGLPEGRTFLGELERFLGQYGHREIRMDILYPTWSEDPAPVLAFVRGYLDADESQSPHRQEERLVRERQELTESVRARLAKNLLGRFVRWPIFRWVLHHAQTHTRERDTMHFELTRLWPPLRKMLLELGRRWQKQGFIAQPDDAFFLTWDELKEMVESPQAMHEAVKANRDALEGNKRFPGPLIIRGSEEIHAEGLDVAQEGQRKGVAGSPGVFTGTARVVRGPEDFGKLEKGEILVAPFTTPVWTPLFALAGGVVTEVGGILSHGAIVAREYGVPAVMGVPGVMHTIVDGQTLTIDGNRGIVHLEVGAAK